MDAVATWMSPAAAGGAAIIASAPAQVHAVGYLAQRDKAGFNTSRAFDEDIGSDGSTPNDRAAAAGFCGQVAGTAAINTAVAIN
jgi:hypothetical protein